MTQTIRLHKAEKGQSLVELAISMLIMLILVAGVVDVGRILFYYIAMRDSAQEGALYGSAYPTHCNQIEDRARSSLVDNTGVIVTTLINGGDCSAATPATACSGYSLKVTVAQPAFKLTMPFIGGFIGSQSINLEASITNTIVRPLCP